MPVYNERAAIGGVLKKWAAALDKLRIDYVIRPYNDLKEFIKIRKSPNKKIMYNINEPRSASILTLPYPLSLNSLIPNKIQHIVMDCFPMHILPVHIRFLKRTPRFLHPDYICIYVPL